MSLRHMNSSVLSDLCRLCNIISNSSQLVIPNTAQCLPHLPDIYGTNVSSNTTTSRRSLVYFHSAFHPLWVNKCNQMVAIISQWWCRLVNAYEVKAGIVCLQCKSCVIYEDIGATSDSAVFRNQLKTH